MTREEALQKLREARVGRLATVRPDGTPHVIPFVFALVEDGEELHVYWAVDDKPKRRTDIQRLANIRANPTVEFVVDRFDEDWTALWWIRVRGVAYEVGSPTEHGRARRALAAKYEPHRRLATTARVVGIRIAGWSAWSAAERADDPTRRDGPGERASGA